MASPAELNQRKKEALMESVAQSKIIRILEPLSPSQRARLIIAADGLVKADSAVSGTIHAFLKGNA